MNDDIELKKYFVELQKIFNDKPSFNALRALLSFYTLILIKQKDPLVLHERLMQQMQKLITKAITPEEGVKINKKEAANLNQ